MVECLLIGSDDGGTENVRNSEDKIYPTGRSRDKVSSNIGLPFETDEGI